MADESTTQTLGFTPKILIADDDVGLCKALETLFRDHGFDTVATNDGMAAWEAAQSQSFHCLLTDMRMPKMVVAAGR